MTETKFTPGPWTLEARRDCCDEFDTYLQPLNLHISDRVSDADVCLIAAAPDLYNQLNCLIELSEALCEDFGININEVQILLSCDGKTKTVFPYIEAIKASKYALAKARGENISETTLSLNDTISADRPENGH